MSLTPLAVHDIVEGKVEKIAFGGDGIVRHRGLVIFVPFTAPGDFISCQITELKRSFAKAELISIHQHSPYRATPLCPYFGTCGGCQLQHLNADEQMFYKREAVKDAFQRIGHLTFPDLSAVPARLKWAYRRHVTLHLRPHAGSWEAGYIGIDNRSLVVVQTCPIFNSEHDTIIKQIQQLVHRIPNSSQGEGRLTILKNHRDQYILSFHFDNSIKVDEGLFTQALQQHPVFAGILFQTPTHRFSVGDPYTMQAIDGLTLRYTPQTFIQNHPEQSLNIYRQICSLTDTLVKKKILDLYCGFGTTSLLFAEQNHTVLGVEYNAEAVTFAQENAKLNRLPHVRFQKGDVERVLPKLAKEFKPDLVLLNPPRTGLSKKIIQVLLKEQPQEMIYVSCMPATLARDLALLCKEVYEIKQGVIYDMFPQTAHVETLIYLRARSRKSITVHFNP